MTAFTSDINALEVCELDFNYETTADQPLFQNFSLNIAQGTLVAVMGPSGSGKSTLGRIMARILKQDQYDARRNEILDMARHLIYTLGYDQMTIHDLLQELHISKGALYHYFASKKGKKNYSAGCSAGKTIKEANRIYFDTASEAQNAGYTLSSSC